MAPYKPPEKKIRNLKNIESDHGSVLILSVKGGRVTKCPELQKFLKAHCWSLSTFHLFTKRSFCHQSKNLFYKIIWHPLKSCCRALILSQCKNHVLQKLFNFFYHWTKYDKKYMYNISFFVTNWSFRHYLWYLGGLWAILKNVFRFKAFQDYVLL